MGNDALKDYEFKSTGLFLKISSAEPVTLRVLTLDPLVSMDKWGNTRYSFVVWNWNEKRAQILSKGSGILKQLTAIHRDKDLEPLDKTDIKITATGEGLETRYTIIPLPKAKELTTEILKEAQKIDLTKTIENGVRLSEYDEGDTELTPPVEEEEYPDPTDEEIAQNDAEILKEIPF